MSALVPGTGAQAACSLEKYAELPVTMHGRQPIIEGSINGRPATFIADSGAFYSMLWSHALERFKLHFRNDDEVFALGGSGGETRAHRTTVDDFSLRGFGNGVFHKIQFLIGGNAIDAEDGVIGQNILGRADAEYDLGNGFIRLFHSGGCENYSLAYWHGSVPVSEMPIRPRTDLDAHIIGKAMLNGVEARVLFDTGGGRSLLGLKAARRAGFDPDKTEHRHSGHLSPLGGVESEVWEWRFQELDLGGEKIRNVSIAVSDSPGFQENFDIVLGVDFFLSHRIYVARSQNKLYFTYNGGPIFDLPSGDGAARQVAAANPPTTPATPAAAMPAVGDDAALLARRGAAANARGDYAHAAEDLDAAIRLNPLDAESYFNRSIARSKLQKPVEAANDLDQALKLKPTEARWLLARGKLRLDADDVAGATADFESAVHLMPAADEPELEVADICFVGGHYAEAVKWADRWIVAHARDKDLPVALNSRCWYRAQWGRELDRALADCNAALDGRPSDGAALDSRGLVWLRLGNYANAVSDYKAALRVSPKQAASLYGLGLAYTRMGDRAEATKRMHEAMAIDSEVAGSFEKIGLSP